VQHGLRCSRIRTFVSIWDFRQPQQANFGRPIAGFFLTTTLLVNIASSIIKNFACATCHQLDTHLLIHAPAFHLHKSGTSFSAIWIITCSRGSNWSITDLSKHHHLCQHIHPTSDTSQRPLPSFIRLLSRKQCSPSPNWTAPLHLELPRSQFESKPWLPQNQPRRSLPTHFKLLQTDRKSDRHPQLAD
jgi:hypothetical protein